MPRPDHAVTGRLTAALTALLVLPLAACSSSASGPSRGGGSAAATTTPTQAATSASSSSPAPAAVEPCQLLTRAEAERLAGTPLQAGVAAGSNGTHTLCQYTGPTSGPTAQVEVFVGDGAKKMLDIDKDTLQHAFTTVPGIGDLCLQEDGNIFVRKNGQWASINLVLLNDPAANVKPLQAAAKIIASRLP